MSLSNNNSQIQQQLAYLSAMKQITDNKPKPPSALNAAMIGRIHNVRPGCGSCGK